MIPPHDDSHPHQRPQPTSRARSGGSARPLSRPATPRRTTPAKPPPRQGTPSHPRQETPTRQFTRPPENPGTESAQPTPPSATPPGVPHPGARRAPGPRRTSAPHRPTGRTRLTRRGRLTLATAALLIIALVAWPVGLGMWADSRIQHVDALSGAADTPGTTTLIAGADIAQGKAQRTDTLMLLHEATNGKKYLVSIPRDTLVDIPGHGGYKINAAYAFGGAPLLVKTVEEFSGLTIDHFAVIGFDGVTEVVDSIGSVNLCIDQDVDDEKSGLKMTKGCHDTGGEQALAFVRARYFDPTADVGRQQRQQQFISALSDRVSSPGVLLNPVTQVNLAGAGTNAIRTDKDTGLIDLGFTALTMKGAVKDHASMSLPIENQNHQTKHSGVAIKVDDEKIDDFFRSIEDGTATPKKK